MRMLGTMGLGALALVTACAHGEVESTQEVPLAQQDLSTLAAFCTAVGRAACSDAVVKGCGATDKEACVRARRLLCERDVPQGTSYESVNAAACIRTIETAQVDAALTLDEVRAIELACGAPMFSGNGDARSPCTSHYDCRTAEGLSCVVRPGAVPPTGKCLKATSRAIGRPCGGEADVCEADAFCDAKSATCKARVPDGQSCGGVQNACAAGLVCDDTLMGSGRCHPRTANGKACASGNDCASGLCDKASAQAEGTCVDAIRLSAAAAACQDHGARTN